MLAGVSGTRRREDVSIKDSKVPGNYIRESTGFWSIGMLIYEFARLGALVRCLTVVGHIRVMSTTSNTEKIAR